MGMIQNSVNQLLGTVAIAAKLSPALETKQTDVKLGRELKHMNKASEVMAADKLLSDSDSRIELENAAADKAKEKFLNLPTPNNKAIWEETGTNAQQTFDSIMDRRAAAMAKVKELGTAQLRQNMTFEEYYNSIRTPSGEPITNLNRDVVYSAYKQEMNKNKETK